MTSRRGEGEGEVMDFWRIFEILSKRKWLIIFSGLVGALLMWGATRLIGARWLGVVDFVVPTQVVMSAPGSATSEQPVTADDSRNQAMLFAALVKSQAVVEPVMRSMDQTQMPADLLKNLDFVSVGPNMYQLQVIDQTAAGATQLANALAGQFVQVYHDVNTQEVAKAVDLLSMQLHTADVALTKSRLRFDAYRQEHQIVGDVNNSVDMAVTNLRQAMEKRDAAQVQATDMQARLATLEALASQVPPPNQATVMASGPYAQEEQDLSKAEDQLDELRGRYLDSMPLVQAAIRTRDAIKNRLAEQWKTDGASLAHAQNASLVSIEDQTRTLKQNLAGTNAQIAALNAEVAQAKSDLASFTGVDLPMSMLAGDVAEKSDERNDLSARLNSARQALDVAERQNPITRMDQVNEFNPPVNTTYGRTLKLILLAALGCMLCTCTLLIGLDSVDKRVRTVRQAELTLPRGLLAAIPQPASPMDYATMGRATELLPHSMYSEAYRFLALHLLNAPVRHVRSLMVLAAKAEQGSTTTLTNLAITLAQAGKRVVVVDANMRTAEIHSVFGVPNDFGFADVLKTPTNEVLDKAMHTSSVDGLSYITSGALPDNLWQLFRSENLQELSDLLRQRADYILYDAPSSLMFTDALNLAPIVDAALLCVRAFESLTGTEERLVAQLETQNVTVLGCVLSDIPASVLESYPNNEYYYGRGQRNTPIALLPTAGDTGQSVVVLAGSSKNGSSAH
jgi:capsular exopolysaccharide synthesis family protein